MFDLQSPRHTSTLHFSETALAAFQRDKDIMETGALDDVTLAKLGIAPT